MKFIAASLIGIIVLLVVVNNFVRVSGHDKSYGYIENLLFDKPFKEKIDDIFRSENYQLYSDVNERSFRVADLLMRYGKNIIEDASLNNKRIEAINSLAIALRKCDLIPDNYIKESNAELLINYRSHFQKSLRLWHDGLKDLDTSKILEGIREYNTFLNWIKSKDRKDFKNMK